MVKSLTFTGEFGYITDKIPEPECPVRGYFGKNSSYRPRDFSESEKEEIKKYEKEYKEWKKHKNEYANPHLVKNLLNRKFEFEAGKINVIFGPNASGKTTMIKAIAGNAGCKDGYPTLLEPLSIRSFYEETSQENFRKTLNKMMKNSAIIEWDGVPVYYDNFADRMNRPHSSIGDLCGSVLGDSIATEIQYIIGKDKISLGQNSIYLINRLLDIAQNHLSFKDIFSKYVNEDGTKKSFNVNDTWADAYNVQLDYYMGFENSCKSLPGTFLFDELDKSLDIFNIYNLYVNVLPEFVKKTGVQVIIISHSPLVLMNKIRNNDMYNFISIDEDYTKTCIEKLTELF
jgi:energy-coupling factor transporter ATP-binding protein EcfA2